LGALKRFLGASRCHFRGLLEASFEPLGDLLGGHWPSKNSVNTQGFWLVFDFDSLQFLFIKCKVACKRFFEYDFLDFRVLRENPLQN